MKGAVSGVELPWLFPSAFEEFSGTSSTDLVARFMCSTVIEDFFRISFPACSLVHQPQLMKPSSVSIFYVDMELCQRS